MHGLKFRDELDEIGEPISRELDALIAKLKAFMLAEHNEDGTHNFGLPTGGQSGESAKGVTPINLNSQSFINNLNPGFVQMLQTIVDSGAVEVGGSGDVVGPSSATDDHLASFDGATGKLIQDSGVTVAQLTALTGTFFTVSGTLSEAQIEALNTSPVQLVAAVPGYVIIPVNYVQKIAVTAGYGGSPTWFLALGTGGSAVTVSGNMTPTLTTATTKYNAVSGFDGASNAANFTTNDPRNVALYLTATGNPAVPATGVATGTWTLVYTLVPLA